MPVRYHEDNYDNLTPIYPLNYLLHCECADRGYQINLTVPQKPRPSGARHAA